MVEVPSKLKVEVTREKKVRDGIVLIWAQKRRVCVT